MLGKFLSRCIAVALLSLPGLGFAAVFTNLFTDMYVIGDSLSDQGNLLTATASVVGPQNAAPGLDHYFNGRFSNGPAYTDVLAQNLGVPLGPSLLNGNNFAFGGARTTYNAAEVVAGGPFPVGLFPWSLTREITEFRNRNIQDPGALYVVWSGSNDIADLSVNPNLNKDLVINGTIAAILDAIDAFQDAGARTILVPNLPDLGLTPLANIRGVVQKATDLSAEFNAKLHAALLPVTGVDIREMDTFSLLRNLVANPSAFGLTNVTTPCYSGFVNPNPNGVECATPDQFLFWDVVHPTRAVHALLAQAALQAIPTPSTLPLVALGLALLPTLALRRRISRA